MDVHVYHHSGQGCGIIGIALLVFFFYLVFHHPGWAILFAVAGIVVLAIAARK